MSEKKYPYIGRGSESGLMVIFYSKGSGITLDSNSWASKNMEHHRGIDESYFTNITPEFLANKYGEVVSLEHASFIIELARRAGFFIASDYSDSIKFFCTSNESLVFCGAEQYAKREREQITIPLPPAMSASASKVNRDIERSAKDKINDEIDQVKSPSHYQLIEGVESIEIIARSMTVEQWQGFCLGNMLKYRIGAGKKDKLQQDIDKANFYGELYEMHKGKCHGGKS